LTDALEIFITANLENKAASAAAELAILTNEPRYIEILRAHCAEKPNSVLTHKLAILDQSERKLGERPVETPAPAVAVARLRPKLELLS
jgi:hypothetical protein